VQYKQFCSVRVDIGFASDVPDGVAMEDHVRSLSERIAPLLQDELDAAVESMQEK